MKRIIIFVCAAIFLTADARAETDDVPKTMYVFASPGLRVRNAPGIEARAIRTLPFLTEVNVIREGDDYIVIDDFVGKWVCIDKPIEGWVFSGYLTAFNFGENLALREDNNDRQQFFGTWVERHTSHGTTWVNIFEISETFSEDGGESFIGDIKDYSEYYGSRVISWTAIYNTDKATMEEFPNGYLVIRNWDFGLTFTEIFLSRDGEYLIPYLMADGTVKKYIRR